MKILTISDSNMMCSLMDNIFSKYDCNLVCFGYDTQKIQSALQETDFGLIIISELDDRRKILEILTLVMNTSAISLSNTIKCLLIRNKNSYNDEALELYKPFLLMGKLLVLLPENKAVNISNFLNLRHWDKLPAVKDLPKKKSSFPVLLVGNSANISKKLSEEMLNKGFDLLKADDGSAGFKLFETYEPAIVITDMEMTKLSGIDLCIKIKELNVYTKVIILSNVSFQETIEKAYHAGADDYIVMPIDEENLISKVRGHLNTLKDKSMNRILVVDDGKLIQEKLQMEFRKNNMDLILASNGIEGFSKAVLENPSIIITDLEMPIMNGYELQSALKSIKNFDETPLIMMSGKFNNVDVNRLASHAPIQFFSKPFDVNKLVMLTEQIIFNKSHQARKDYEHLISSIWALITALEARDQYTMGHSERVTAYASMVGRELGFTSQQMRTLEVSAALHDIGKIGIRDDILLKPSRLSDEEFNVIKEHSALGSKILSSIESLEWVSHVILHHHERYDGTGYPDGVREKDIPIESRIISVVDTFDAITSLRPYRKTFMSIENAKCLLSEMAGSQLCPVCVNAFLTQLTLKDQLNGILTHKGGLS